MIYDTGSRAPTKETAGVKCPNRHALTMDSHIHSARCRIMGPNIEENGFEGLVRGHVYSIKTTPSMPHVTWLLLVCRNAREPDGRIGQHSNVWLISRHLLNIDGLAVVDSFRLYEQACSSFLFQQR